MSRHDDIPTTPAIRALRAANAAFTAHSYKYEERGGTAQAARELGLDEHRIVKTIVLKNGAGKPLIMLMHGDREISTKNLARARKVKTVQTCAPETADRHSGYHVGGTSPFGTRKRMTVYVQRTIYDLPEIYINAGHRGILVAMNPKDLDVVLAGLTVPVDVAIE